MLPQERRGTVANVVFPTGIGRRDDRGSPQRFDVHFGIADNRIGAARLDLPDSLPPGGVADPPEAQEQRHRSFIQSPKRINGQGEQLCRQKAAPSS